MDERRLIAYLRMHLAGSGAGITTAQVLLRSQSPGELEAFLRRFVDELQEERAVVRSLLDRFPSDRGVVRGALDLAGGAAAGAREAVRSVTASVHTAEDLETLAIGVWGKRLLWGALDTLRAGEPRLAGPDYDALASQAEEQEHALLRFRQGALDAASASA
jgi:hypothetical protein